MSKSFLFIVGTPHSGTAQMWQVLRRHDAIALGHGRFQSHSWRDWSLTPELYEKDRFFDLTDAPPSDRIGFDQAPDYFAELQDRYDDCTLHGDTLPLSYLQAPRLAENFPGARVVVLIRNIYDVIADHEAVAARKNLSIEDALDGIVAQWNRSLNFVLSPPARLNVIPVIYETLFLKQKGLNHLCARLDLAPGGPIESALSAMSEKQSQLQKKTPLVSVAGQAAIAQSAFVLAHKKLMRDAKNAAKAD